MNVRPLTRPAGVTVTAPPPAPAGRARSGVGAPSARQARVDRLLRTGHLLTASSVASSGLGAAYWVFVARWYSAAEVGRGYATVSAMMFLAGFGQLNLANTLVRFVPSAGRRTLRLIRRVYLVAACTTAALAAGFVTVVPRFSPQLSFLHSTGAGIGFVLASAGYAVFVVQDGALTGLLRADWVLYENALFALAKILFVVGLSVVAVGQGILVSWYASLLLALLVTNWFLFSRAMPRRIALSEPQSPDAGRPTLRYLATDFAGSTCWLVATTLMPMFVLDRLGADQGAYFSLAWMVAYTFYLLSTNMGSSLIVEAAKDGTRLAADCHRLLRHTGFLLGVGVAAGCAAAPWILRVFGPGYAMHATGLLRLLLLSALPNLVITAAVAVGRARRRVGAVVGVLFSVCALALGLSAVMLPTLGIAGAGYGWLIAQCSVATVLLVRDSWWLGPPPERAAEYPSRGAELVHAAMNRVARLRTWPGDRIAAFRLARALTAAPCRTGQAIGPALRAAHSKSDLLVIRIRGREGLALKCARTELARQTLTRQLTVLRSLHADERLGAWRTLLPRVVDCDLEDSPAWIAEGWLPGRSGSALLRERPALAARLTGAAMGVIEELHRATGRRERVGEMHLVRWIDEPVRTLEGHLRLCAPWPYAEALELLRDRLHRRVHGRVLAIGWVHRDFHPGNVLFARDGRRVTGIVDWGGAVPGGPTEIDRRLFDLALRSEAGGGCFGDLVVASLRADDDGLLLLAWLWHVTDNLEKSARFLASRLWIRRNVLDVLDALKAVRS